MTRLAVAALLGLALTAAATAQPAPPLGKSVQIEFTGREPKDQAGFRIAYDLPIQQGDRFRVQMDPVGGVKMTLLAQAWRTAVVHHESSQSGPRIDWTVREGLPGKAARITLHSQDVGAVNVLITRLKADGTPYAAAAPAVPAAGLGAAPGVEERLRRLEDQNALILRELADLRRLVEQKK